MILTRYHNKKDKMKRNGKPISNGNVWTYWECKILEGGSADDIEMQCHLGLSNVKVSKVSNT
jgi:hypothetical protein